MFDLFKRKYTYYVSYTFKDGVNIGSGSMIIDISRKIKSVSTINSVIDHIKKTTNFESIVILSYFELKGE